MPSHPDRVRQNYCEHEWHIGVMSLAEIYVWKCFKCDKSVHMPPSNGIILSSIDVPSNYLGIDRSRY